MTDQGDDTASQILGAAALGDLAGFASRLADAAGEAVRPWFRNLQQVERKDDKSPVTVADRAAEQAMRELILEAYPDHGVFGEEFGVTNPDARQLWILDPIDGTKSFVAGLPLFCTLIALTDEAGFALGVIDQPIVGDRWVGVRGVGTAQNGATVRCRSGIALADAVLATTTIEFLTPPQRAACDRLLGDVRLFRLCGDAYIYGLLASGQIDIVFDTEVQPYDFAALVTIVEGAGGVITDWSGAPLPVDRPSRVLAAGDRDLHRSVLGYLAGV
ncbi:MAG: histidinol-phosphatase [Sneathiellaceae bacterium]